jgi:hypothetical protein
LLALAGSTFSDIYFQIRPLLACDKFLSSSRIDLYYKLVEHHLQRERVASDADYDVYVTLDEAGSAVVEPARNFRVIEFGPKDQVCPEYDRRLRNNEGEVLAIH